MNRIYFKKNSTLNWVEATPLPDGSGFARITNTNAKETDPVLHELWCKYTIINHEDLKKGVYLKMAESTDTQQIQSLYPVARIEEFEQA